MTSTSTGLFWTQHEVGMMSATLVLPFYPILEDTFGTRARDDLFAAAGFSAMPPQGDSVPETKVARLHQGVRDSWPDQARALSDQAGRVAAEAVVSDRISPKARLLLQNMPWSVAAWLVGRTARQNARAFAGSGVFSIQTTGRFALFRNPLVLRADAPRPSCDFHAAFFEHMFQRLVHRDFTCTETACVSCGDEYCQFDLDLPGGAELP